MLNRINKRKSEGFTIIEVMIVLAIAGLILLIVFLAVPALQRNSRNTQRKNDVSALIGSINEYTSNNGGAIPTTCASAVAGAKLGYYTSGCIAGAGGVSLVTLTSPTQPALAATAANDKVVIVTRAQCGSNGAATAGSIHQVAIQYNLETASGYTPSCQSS